mmetsp:Transcript_45595/g.145210  ORF Transcript_45595/g.145210 Transcript_45595/m.145210 type:complete len:208 (+) Transcript_45595:414-1037(+)
MNQEVRRVRRIFHCAERACPPKRALLIITRMPPPQSMSRHSAQRCSVMMESAPPPPPCLAISTSMSRRFIATSPPSMVMAPSMSASQNAPTWESTRRCPSASNARTRNLTLKTSSTCMFSRTSRALEVPTTSSFLPSGGARFTRTRRVCRTTLENRGPMGTYSSSLSISSSTTMLRGLLYASSNTLKMALHLALSVNLPSWGGAIRV